MQKSSKSTERKLSPQDQLQNGLWLQGFLHKLYVDGTRSAPVRQLLLACAHNYHAQNLRDLNTFANQCDGEAAASVGPRTVADRVPLVVDACPRAPATPPAPTAMDTLADVASAVPAAPLVGVEPNPGPLWDKILDAAVAGFAALPAGGPVPGRGLNPIESYARLRANREATARVEHANARWAKQQSQVKRVPVRGLQPSTAATQAIEPNPGPPKGGRRRRAMPTKKRAQVAKAKPATAPSRAPTQVKPKGSRGDALQRSVPDVLDRTDKVLSTAVDSTGGPIAEGTLIYRCPINPTGGGRTTSPGGINAQLLNYFAALFENFDCTVTFIFKGTGNAFTTGTYTAGFEMDPSDSTPTIDRLISQGGQTFTYGKGGRISYAPGNRSKANTLYWCQSNGSDPRLTQKGVFYVLSNESPSTYGNTGTANGCIVPFQVHCHYRFRFRNPTFEPQVTPSTGAAPSGYGHGLVPGFATYDPWGWSGAYSLPASQFYMPGIVCGQWTTGGHTYGALAFLTNTIFDDWDGVAVGGSSVGTFSAGYLDVVTGTWTVGNNQVGGSALASLTGKLVFALTKQTMTLTNSYQQVANGSWANMGATRSYSVWGAIALSIAGSQTSDAPDWCVTPLGSYVPTLRERQWAQCGPATLHGRLEGPFLELKAAAAEAKSQLAVQDAAALRARLRELEAERRPDEKLLSSLPPRGLTRMGLEEKSTPTSWEDIDECPDSPAPVVAGGSSNLRLDTRPDTARSGSAARVKK